MENETLQDFGWSILELMGHRRLAGKLSEAIVAGAPMLRIDVPGQGDAWATQFYGASSIYCITPTTEEIARAVCAREQPAPVQRWELPAVTGVSAAAQTGTYDPEVDYEPDDDDPDRADSAF